MRDVLLAMWLTMLVAVIAAFVMDRHIAKRRFDPKWAWMAPVTGTISFVAFVAFLIVVVVES